MKKLLLAVLMTAVLALAGCGQVHVEVEPDGKSTFTFTVPIDELGFSVNYMEEELKNIVDEMNTEYGEGIAKIKSMKEKDGIITGVIEIKAGAVGERGAIIVPVKDMYRLDPQSILTLQNVEGETLTTEQVEDYENYNYLHFELDDMMAETTLTLPGEVVYMSNGVQLTEGDKNTVETDRSSVTLIYENKAGMSFTTIIFVLLGIGAVVAVFVLRKKRAKKVSPFAAQEQQVEGGNTNA